MRAKDCNQNDVKYRKDLARELLDLRSQGEEGKERARKFLHQERKSLSYVLSSYGHTPEGAQRLIYTGYGWMVYPNPEKFGITYTEEQYMTELYLRKGDEDAARAYLTSKLGDDMEKISTYMQAAKENIKKYVA